jgi:predicted unusual protein kinase regulating ubiquinone biosynthesis (AarF/ABC1/UbiB family)
VLGKPRGLKLAASTGSKHVNARDTVQCCNAKGAALSGVGSGVEHLQVLIDAVVHAVNKDYEGMAGDFVNLGFLASGTDVAPIVPALENIWADSLGQSLGDFNFRTVTSKFNELVFQYPIRIPERYSLVIRSLLTQEGICMTLDPSFHFLEVAYPYVAKRLLTDDDLRERLFQVPCFASLLFAASRLLPTLWFDVPQWSGKHHSSNAQAPPETDSRTHAMLLLPSALQA